MVGVISHLANPTADQVVEFATTAEAAGADWLGVADAFWWRDTWVLLAEAARATTRLTIGPTTTNPYLRHPFHTLSGIATLQELAGPRVMVGIAAGGSEVSLAAHVSRRDAAERVADLVTLIRAVAGGAPLDEESGKHLELPLSLPPILIAARGNRMLATAGRHADRALLWAVPQSDLDRTVERIRAGAREGRAAPGEQPEIVWAPLVLNDASVEGRVRRTTVYAALNSAPEVRRRWGLDDQRVESIRTKMVQASAEAAADEVPDAALDDLIFRDPDPSSIASAGRAIGATSIAIPGFDTATLSARIGWAKQVESLLGPA
ncbi:MAG TPA: LLM class flavin-dependent oxidoreductase [Chloroflexota bacterium]|nr:LLM class flavin-dependent oxidoreductase [Chloroflexota bacterium]